MLTQPHFYPRAHALLAPSADCSCSRRDNTPTRRAGLFVLEERWKRTHAHAPTCPHAVKANIFQVLRVSDTAV